jgi:hypothetical protein
VLEAYLYGTKRQPCLAILNFAGLIAYEEKTTNTVMPQRRPGITSSNSIKTG